MNKARFSVKVTYLTQRSLLLWQKHKAPFTIGSGQEPLCSWGHQFKGFKANPDESEGDE